MKYFDYGLPARYALVDSVSRSIWLVTPSEIWAHELKHIWSGKTNFTVYSLCSFENYSENILDNSICFNWSVAEVVHPMADPVGLLTAQTTALASELNHPCLIEKNTVTLPEALAQDFQQQIMLTYLLIKTWHENRMNEFAIDTANSHYEQYKLLAGRASTLEQLENSMAECGQDNLINYTFITVHILELLERLWE